MHEDLSLLFVKVRDQRHQLLELGLVGSVLLVGSLVREVELLNEVLEVLALGVHSLEDLGRNEVLIVKLSDLLLLVEHQVIELIPLSTVHLGEKVPLLLALLWLRQLLSLGKIEGKSKELLAVGGVVLLSVGVIDSCLVHVHLIVNFLNQLVERSGRKGLGRVVDLVDKHLDFLRVSIASLKLSFVNMSKVLESVDLSKLPEDIICVFAHSLDAELASKVLVNLASLSNTVEHLSFGERSRCVNIQVALNILLGISLCTVVFKESELGNKVLVAEVDVSIDSSLVEGSKSVLAVSESREHSVLHLHCNVVSSHECRSSNGHSHPGLSEDWVASCSGILERSSLVSNERTNASVEKELLTLEPMVLVKLLSIGSVIAELLLKTLNLLFSSS